MCVSGLVSAALCINAILIFDMPQFLICTHRDSNTHTQVNWGICEVEHLFNH